MRSISDYGNLRSTVNVRTPLKKFTQRLEPLPSHLHRALIVTTEGILKKLSLPVRWFPLLGLVQCGRHYVGLNLPAIFRWSLLSGGRKDRFDCNSEVSHYQKTPMLALELNRQLAKLLSGNEVRGKVVIAAMQKAVNFARSLSTWSRKVCWAPFHPDSETF